LQTGRMNVWYTGVLYRWAERNTNLVPGVLILSQVQAWNISKCATETRA